MIKLGIVSMLRPAMQHMLSEPWSALDFTGGWNLVDQMVNNSSNCPPEQHKSPIL